jgi:hypothetical protein
VAAFYLDQDVILETAIHLRSYGHDVETTRASGRLDASDGEQLLAAAANGWILVSHNGSDFELLHDAWLRWGAASSWSLRHAGIFIIPQQFWSPAQAAEQIDAFVKSGFATTDELYIFERANQVWERFVLRR